MKEISKLFVIAALVAAMGFTMTACGDSAGNSNDGTASVTYTSDDPLSHNTYTLTITSAARAAAYTPKAGDNWKITSTDDRLDGKSGNVVSVSGSIIYTINLGTITLSGYDEDGIFMTVTVGLIVTITDGGMTKMDAYMDGVVDERVLVPEGSPAVPIITTTSVTGTRYVYVMPDWGYLNTFKFNEGIPAASGTGTAYFEAGPNHISCPFTYTLAGVTLTIRWPTDIGVYNVDNPTTEQAVAASLNVYSNGNFTIDERLDLSVPRMFTMTSGNVVGTTSTTIFGVTTEQSFVFVRRD